MTQDRGITIQAGRESRKRRVPGEAAALVVDTSLPVRVQMRSALSPVVSRVDFAETAERTLRLINLHSYSMIFLDMKVPDADMYEVCSRIKGHPLQERASLIMLTSSESSAERVMGMLAGFDNYLSKPIQREAFNEVTAAISQPPAAI
jgi:two-component system, cell cycle response regulator